MPVCGKHQHFSNNDGALDLANGVTSARDMANDTEGFLDRVARFDSGSELGPHVFKAGIIDGTGPLAGPTKMRVIPRRNALKDVNWYGGPRLRADQDLLIRQPTARPDHRGRGACTRPASQRPRAGLPISATVCRRGRG